MSFPAPAVSLIVPCRNEARHIRDCLDSLLAMDYPAGRLEILVVDGESDDGTPAIVREYLAQHACIRLLLGILLSTYPLAALGCCAGLLRRDPKAGLASALAFPVLHLSYGLGFLAGMLRLARGRGRWKERALPVPLSR